MALQTHRDKAEKILNELTGEMAHLEQRAQAHAVLALVDALTPISVLAEKFAYPETMVDIHGAVVDNGPLQQLLSRLDGLIDAVREVG